MKNRLMTSLLLIVIVVTMIGGMPAAAGSPHDNQPRAADTTERFTPANGTTGHNEGATTQVADTTAREELTVLGQDLESTPPAIFPGFYAAWDWRNIDPVPYGGLVGGSNHFTWKEIEPTEGNFNWGILDNFIANEAVKGKKAGFGINPFYGRSGADNAIQIPDYVFQAGVEKLVMVDGFRVPNFWNPIYIQKYRRFIERLAQRYDNNPNLAFVQVGVGRHAETQPCDDRDNGNAGNHPDGTLYKELLDLGYDPWGWAGVVNQMIDAYADNFHRAKLLLPFGPVYLSECERRDTGNHAIARGVGLMPSSALADYDWVDHRTSNHGGVGNWNGCGRLDRILDYAEKGYFIQGQNLVPVAFEFYGYMTPTSNEVYWAVLGTLNKRADYVNVEDSVLFTTVAGDPVLHPNTENINTIRWAGAYIGKRADNTPSAWVALRESGFSIGDPSCPVPSYQEPQKGNYHFYLNQDDNVSGGKTVAATWRNRQELAWPYVDWQNRYNACIEVEQAFLGGTTGIAREGWITRRTNQSSGNPYMWFKLDDTYRSRYAGSTQVTIRVTYLDRGTDSWRLDYDSTTSAYKLAGVVTKTNSGTWRTATFVIDDARVQNGQLGGADFRINSRGDSSTNDGDEYIHVVDVTFDSQPTQTYNLNLTTGQGGWNLVSIPLVPASSAITNVLASIAGKYDLVQAYIGGAWRSYSPTTGGDLTTIGTTMGFWLHATQPCTLVVVGEAPSSTSIALAPGWNLIGWPSDNATPVATALAGIAGSYDAVYGFDATDGTDPWKLYGPSLPSYANDLALVDTGRGYWIRATSACTLQVAY